MDTLNITLGLATLLCSLVAGFVLAFAIVVMPGIRSLDDREFLNAFKVMDGVIQKGQPIFGLVWLGSIVTLGLAVGVGIFQLEGINRILVILAALVYFAGVQFTTFTKNIPLNNKLQIQDLDTSSEAALAETREVFETQWIPWNSRRTFYATLTAVILITVMLRI